MLNADFLLLLFLAIKLPEQGAIDTVEIVILALVET